MNKLKSKKSFDSDHLLYYIQTLLPNDLIIHGHNAIHLLFSNIVSYPKMHLLHCVLAVTNVDFHYVVQCVCWIDMLIIEEVRKYLDTSGLSTIPDTATYTKTINYYIFLYTDV